MTTSSHHLNPDHVAVDVRAGLPSVTVVGAPDRYSWQLVGLLRGRNALPAKRITVSLHPHARRTLPDVAELADVVATVTQEA